nr:RNA-directed DNA polymerase, eukaryota [Tanacetum cinerariifolium]
MIWIEIRDLPLCAWGSNAYKKVAYMFGKFIFFEADESTKMSSGRICISTKSHNFVSERILVEVHEVNYDVHVHELGTWNINIVDETLDSSDNLDVNGNWRNTVSGYYIINIYGPQDSLAKSILWNRIGNIMHQYAELSKLEEHNFGRKLFFNEKYRLLKARIKHCHSKTKTSDRVTKHDKMQLIKSINEKIDSESFTNDEDHDSRIKLLQEVEKFDTFESFDLFQKRRVKWDIEGDENSKFFHRLLKQKRRTQMIHGIMKECVWITNPSQIKEEFLNFFKEKFKDHDLNVDFPPFANTSGLCAIGRDSLETPVSLNEVKNAIWDWGSSKAPGLDRFSFAFVKKY